MNPGPQVETVSKFLQSIQNIVVSIKELAPTIKNVVGFLNGPATDVYTDDDEIPEEGYLTYPRARPKKKPRRRKKVTSNKKRARTKKRNNT
ncbi:hypothetical protein SD70_10845 [Gordoniibacillus kamchatkensis]|uniref:Uncharacterized protein n=1 Tax=Gordoniibacillus kamchatkensis TaxID=1590651 RepID=A0ABR5AIY8_9BACL|nr:hypothetical protein SD70_10845 [Paenibacillus sp. VKM B-2647]